MSFGNFLENTLVNQVFGQATFSTVYGASAPEIWVGLSASDPLDDFSGVDEPSTYKRIQVVHSDWTVTANQAKNDQTIAFSAAASNWGSIPWCFIASHSIDVAASDCLASGSLVATKTVNTGDSIQFLTDAFVVTLS